MRTKSTKSPKSTDKKLAAAALLAVAALTLTACGGGDDKKPVAEVSAETDSGKAATVLDKPYKKPNLVLTDTHGKKYDLREETKGKPTLIYFGYTHCPDVCPLTMNNIAVAKKALPKADQDKLEVVFVTTDPERDTPAELGKWLKGVDADFVGLTGDFATIQAGARQLAISIEPSKKDKNGKIVSMHGTQVLAFSPKNDAGYVLYGEDATAGDYTKDLPKLLKGQTP
ncbi:MULTISPECIES: SCO family protein [Streptomyces]|uniref:Thioredoxin domain-containing protein n=1 Tax=Streptomyces venezuelae TaxID=54571 RepID=A0A5P2BDV0_STRVZ|nr:MULTISPECIES: SCO family protein [Streptomyces]NDZ98023.1 SCO family protein [Streptomyces sp. SID10116]MYY82413.1 redoxin domain-containing protein [Streptomyces sp. SID335]MYZ13954.1 redoxin domain-containing protein [Streptomyces sp. SID337]NDZ91179.1 SCO family protein [Streptomyces sp. SID10115]NEB49569.1 SCO family protein [Streptomyces sp. SID339]